MKLQEKFVKSGLEMELNDSNNHRLSLSQVMLNKNSSWKLWDVEWIEFFLNHSLWKILVDYFYAWITLKSCQVILNSEKEMIQMQVTETKIF